MRVLYCGYRGWSFEVLARLKRLTGHDFDLVTSPPELQSSVEASRPDVIIVVGWSWIIDSNIVNDHVVVGMHPSQLPAYAGGSPIQHQIIDGLESSQATLFRLTSRLDGGTIVATEPFQLEGHLDQVLSSIIDATVKLIVSFLDGWPEVQYHEQEGHMVPRHRLKPEHSRLQKDEIPTLTCRQLWNVIRCREDPYPNVYIEDETGRLTFKRVEFEAK